mmetsp:Transcript_79523/g.257549  ORF Transcript_79523/g.257549 Transcript_79523/m.257549 type:complete len:340 (-) Transcript_79523:274-1293(-)
MHAPNGHLEFRETACQSQGSSCVTSCQSLGMKSSTGETSSSRTTVSSFPSAWPRRCALKCPAAQPIVPTMLPVVPMFCRGMYASAWAFEMLKALGMRPSRFATSKALFSRMSMPSTNSKGISRSARRRLMMFLRSVLVRRLSTYSPTLFWNHCLAKVQSSRVQRRGPPCTERSQTSGFRKGEKGTLLVPLSATARSCMPSHVRWSYWCQWQPTSFMPTQHQFRSSLRSSGLTKRFSRSMSKHRSFSSSGRCHTALVALSSAGAKRLAVKATAALAICTAGLQRSGVMAVSVTCSTRAPASSASGCGSVELDPRDCNVEADAGSAPTLERSAAGGQGASQ